MSDPAAEPGVPAENHPSTIPPAAEKSVSAEVQKRAPSLVNLARTPDKILLRLNKYVSLYSSTFKIKVLTSHPHRLLAAPGGLSAFLSTFNYTLYLLTYLEAKSLPLQAKLFQRLGKAAYPTTATPGPSSIAALATLLSSCRTTLRLLGVPPLYAWLRQLLQGPKQGQDRVLYATALTQCVFYLIFQSFENIALLTDHKVLSSSLTSRFNKSGNTARIYIWSYRAWFAGVVCDFVRLAREAQLEKQRRASRTESEKGGVSTLEEDQKADAKWWADAVVPAAWFPFALHCALESGLPGFNLGVMGLSGGIAGLSKFVGLWQATA